MLKNELKTETEVDEEILAMDLNYVRKYQWYLCDIQGTKAILPNTTEACGYDIFETNKHKRMPVPNDMYVNIFPERYIRNPLAISQFQKKVKYSEIPLGWLIKPGVVEE